MKESSLIKSIESRLPKTIHKQSMTSVSLTHAGTPDRYYDGPSGDLWVEYKALAHKPRSGRVAGSLTALQKHWLERRHNNGNNAVVVVGLPDRTACLQVTPEEWINGSPAAKAIPLSEVSQWITVFCGG